MRRWEVRGNLFFLSGLHARTCMVVCAGSVSVTRFVHLYGTGMAPVSARSLGIHPSRRSSYDS